MLHRIQVIDSHTGGEPTRVVIAGGPDLGRGSMVERRQRLASEFDWFRSAVVNEPRGSDVLVGAILCEVEQNADADSPVCGTIFFNNVGCLGMCGHGTIGLAVTLGHLGRIGPGMHAVDTPVGRVSVEYDGANTAAIENVPSYRHAAGVRLQIPGYGAVVGDIAYGGNWFFLVNDHGQKLELTRAHALTEFAWRIRRALALQGITGAAGAEIDHIELFGPPHDPANHSRNFVLCPGGAYDRSPCGTGTSAKLACLAAEGKLAAGETWRQESILGSVFEGSYCERGGLILPRIRGTAYITAESQLVLDDSDPMRTGIPAALDPARECGVQ
jgi:4-hydroxyproline epimerase